MLGNSVAINPIPLAEPWFPSAYGDAIRDQFLSGFVGPGRTTEAFARAIAEYAGAAKCVLTTSGTIALSVAARALGLKPGDEILVPAYGVISTINAFASIGLRPRLVDIDRATRCMSPDECAATISDATRAVCFVNFSGYTGANLVAIADACALQSIPLIEDAACALGHRYRGRAAGTFGTIGIYSFSVPKVLTTGQGGAVVTNDLRLFEAAAAFVDHGDLQWRQTNLNRSIGTNLRFNDLLAALGLCQIRDLDQRLERRRASFTALNEGLRGRLYSVPGEQAPLHNLVFTREPDRLVAELKEVGIAAVRQYRTINGHPAYRDLAGPFPSADYWTDHAVYLPFGMALLPEHGERIAEAVLHSGVPLQDPPQT
jgi:perosamine synthetase